MKQSFLQNVQRASSTEVSPQYQLPPSTSNAMFERNSKPTATRRRFFPRTVATLAIGLLAACGGGSTPGSTPPGQVGESNVNDDGTVWFLDSNAGGQATALFIEEVYWGRLVDLFDATGTLYHRNFLIGEDIQSDGVNFQVDTNPVTEAVSLTILHDFGTPGYDLAFAATTANLGPILPKGIENSLPPFSFMPRNAAIGIRFSDLVDPNTLNGNTIQVLTGNPPSAPFEARLLPDPNYGGMYNGEFLSTRVIIDTTISEIDAAGTLLGLNSLGLPPSLTTALPNVGIRIPTAENFAVGQFQVLENPTNHPLSAGNNGPVDFASPTVDVVRGIRSGGDAELTGDSNNGFLLDLNAPQLVGAQPVQVTSIVSDAGAGADRYVVSLEYASLTCGTKPLDVGTVVTLSSGVFLEVVLPTATPALGALGDINVQLLAGDVDDLIAGPGQVLSTFTADQEGLEDCFFSFSPLAGSLPNADVAPDAQVVIRFSEPMDPASLQPFDTFTVTRAPENPGLSDYIVGEVQPSADLKQFRFVPRLPLAHSLGTAETYYVNLGADGAGVTDLAGNTPANLPDQISFTLAPSKPSEANGGLVLRFGAPDEDGDGFNEYQGQFLLNVDGGSIRPRPVERIAGLADQPTKATVGKMINFPLGVQTPLTPLGSRMMCVYRYMDVALSLTDNTAFNMDVEGLNWSPVGGQVQADFYEAFEINLSHSVRLPDEDVNTALLPTKPQSGLRTNSFLENVLVDDGVDQVTMHEQGLGYLIDPINLFLVGQTALMPYPINKNKPESEWTFYTWRDTSIGVRGGQQSNGIPTQIENTLGILPLGITPGQLANPIDVPSLGLPLLVEVKCYPSDEGIGLNALACAIAINSSSLPTFRIFSTGGFDESLNPQVKNPDVEIAPSGGYNANPQLPQPLGSTTPPRDNVFYYGQLDLVVRVSRVVTRWLDSGDSSPDYLEPVIEPRPEDQPTGTTLTVDYRAASTITLGLDEEDDPAVNADALNIYGEQPAVIGNKLYSSLLLQNPNITFQDGQRWKTTLQAADGAQYFQLRFTFINNTISGLSPTLSAFGVAFVSNS